MVLLLFRFIECRCGSIVELLSCSLRWVIYIRDRHEYYSVLFRGSCHRCCLAHAQRHRQPLESHIPSRQQISGVSITGTKRNVSVPHTVKIYSDVVMIPFILCMYVHHRHQELCHDGTNSDWISKTDSSSLLPPPSSPLPHPPSSFSSGVSIHVYARIHPSIPIATFILALHSTA